MRCKECKVDLPEFYAKCPLCGSKTVNEKPLIENIKTAEYPKVQAEKRTVNAFSIFLIIWAISTISGIVLYRANLIHPTAFTAFISVVPLVWTSIFRPVFIKQLYYGNYIVMNFFSLNLVALVYGISVVKSNTYYSIVFPVIALIIAFDLLCYVLLRSNSSFRAGPYCILLSLYNIVGAIVMYVTTKENPLLWLAPLALTAVLFCFIYLKNRERTKEEIRAKFSIQ